MYMLLKCNLHAMAVCCHIEPKGLGRLGLLVVMIHQQIARACMSPSSFSVHWTGLMTMLTIYRYLLMFMLMVNDVKATK